MWALYSLQFFWSELPFPQNASENLGELSLFTKFISAVKRGPEERNVWLWWCFCTRTRCFWHVASPSSVWRMPSLACAHQWDRGFTSEKWSKTSKVNGAFSNSAHLKHSSVTIKAHKCERLYSQSFLSDSVIYFMSKSSPWTFHSSVCSVFACHDSSYGISETLTAFWSEIILWKRRVFLFVHNLTAIHTEESATWMVAFFSVSLVRNLSVKLNNQRYDTTYSLLNSIILRLAEQISTKCLC